MKGSCLCGAVTFEATGTPTFFVFDHCSRCRKSSGSAFKAAPIRKAPPGYRRAFCAICGGPVPTVDTEAVNIPAGTLDDDPPLLPQSHIFVAHKASWFEITDQLPRFPEK